MAWRAIARHIIGLPSYFIHEEIRRRWMAWRAISTLLLLLCAEKKEEEE
jgi:hypothetical protein